MKVIDKIAWINILDGRILSTRSMGKDAYYIPGGKRENGESDEETLIREIREELCVNIVPNTIKYVGQFKAQAHGQAQGVTVQMTCYSSDYIGELKAGNEIEEIVWFTHKDRDLSSPVDRIIFDWLYEKGSIKA